MKVLVTGGAGYIGSHIIQNLQNAGYSVESVDNLSTGNPETISCRNYKVDLRDREFITDLLMRKKYDAVVHCAASAIVSESVEKPLRYYKNNVSSAINLLSACKQAKVKKFIFSSSAAIYGELNEVPVKEDALKQPINPYGWTKLMVEQMLADIANVNPNFRYIALRYFNVAGADPNGRIGQGDKVLTHLIKIAAQAAAGKRRGVKIFGTNYPTRDGTCERDYVHVSDLASAHERALSHLNNYGNNDTFNVGYGHGYTVREVVNTMRQLGEFEIEETHNRNGDPARLVADNSKIKQVLDWQPQYDNLETICRTALEWEKKLK